MASRKTMKDPDDLFTPTEAEVDLEEFLDSIGEGTSFVEIFRLVRPGTDYEQLDRVPFDEIRHDLFDYLRQRFGPGKYRLKFKTADNKYRAHRSVLVGAQTNPTSTAPATSSNGHGPGNRFEEFMEKQFAMQQTMMLGFLNAIKPAPPPDYGSMMTGLGAIMNSAPKFNPIEMFTALVAANSQIKGPGKDEDYLERFQKIAALMRDLMPNNNHEEPTVLGVVRDVAKEVASRLLPYNPNAQPVRELPAAPLTETVLPAETAIQTTTQGVDTVPQKFPAKNDQAGWVRVGLAYLKEKAKLDKDPEVFVTVMLEAYEEPQWSAILGAVQNGATFENLLQFDPEIEKDPKLKGWFQRLFDDVYTEIFKPMDTSGEARNDSDASSDVRVGAEGSNVN